MGVLSACGSENRQPEDDAEDVEGEFRDDEEEDRVKALGNVSLTLWGAKEDQQMLQGMIDSFIEDKDSIADWEIKLGICSEADAVDVVTPDVAGAADVYAFASDQIQALYRAGALQEVVLNTEEVVEANGSIDSEAIRLSTIDGRLYAYPMTSGNTYFLYYNKAYITSEDAKSLDAMLQVAADNGKKVVMDMTSGWYNYSFFGGAGFELTLNEDDTNTCDFNGTSASGIKGKDVLRAMLDLCADPGFASMTDEELQEAVAAGDVIAAVSGAWNAQLMQKTWGKDCATAKLPEYTCKDEPLQMYSFMGYKMVGVNPHSKNVGAAMMLAEWITNEENQKIRFEERGEAPTNVAAAASDEVKSDIAVSACNAQRPFTIPDGCESSRYWDPMTRLGEICIEGNVSGGQLQSVLDETVAAITHK